MNRFGFFVLLTSIFFSHFVFGQTNETTKYYVDPHAIYATSSGLFVEINGNVLAVPQINADIFGTYILGIVERCPMCNWPTISGFCTNPNCPSKG